MSQTVTIIVPVKDDQKGINNLFNLIEKQSYPLELFNLIVVDNNSEPPLKLERDYLFNYQLLREKKPSGFAARNRAVHHASSEILAFTDADCFPDGDWIKNAVIALNADSSVAAVAGSVTIFTTESPSAVEKYEMVFGFPQKHYVENLHFGVTANLITRKSVFEKIGYFNESLYSGGDHEWGRRLYESGEKMLFVNDVKMNHPARKSWSELREKIERTIGGHCDIHCHDGLTLKLFMREIIFDLFPIHQLFFIIKQDRVPGFIDKLHVLGVIWRLKIYRVFLKVKILLKKRGN